MLHTRQFLEYHKSRFQDRSLLIFEDERLVGLLPAAESLQDATIVSSHPGATYGGIIHDGRLCGAKMIEAVEVIGHFYRECGYRNLDYKAIPDIYSIRPAQDDLYALFRFGASLFRKDLSSAIRLDRRGAVSSRRKRSLKKALEKVIVSEEICHLDAVWHVLQDNLQRKHGTQPVHSLPEIAELFARFPEQVRLFCALIDDQVEAGVVLFNSRQVWHAQYIASSQAGYSISALDALFENIIACAGASGAEYFDFGISTEQSGRFLNDGLYRFKTEFGSGGVVHEFYRLSLS
ncbi:MAG: GNAT family N-acetyltransferase [Corticimicrobacter sp.]|uniref:GNAT family N-acetyltransferase n=1 Tax=Corticimicrobacter sp. TaxID=2678536 RepID=UPI0032DA8BCD